MQKTVDREMAEEAKEKAERASTKEFLTIHLCPACNQPCLLTDANPNEYVGGSNREAYQFHPEKILDIDPDNPWNQICVVPETAEMDDGEELRVFAYKHDESIEPYQVWEDQFEKLKDQKRKAEENNSLTNFK